MASINTQKQSRWFSKFYLCFLALVGAANVVLFVTLPLFPFHLSQYIMPIGFTTLALAVLFSIGFSINCHIKERKEFLNFEKQQALLVTLLRFWLAFNILTFGVEKIIGVNFAHSYHVDDTLISALNGQELTWKYYGFSYGLSLIVAAFQIIGSFLLLFRRTILLGVAILLPVMFNIVLINIFYGIGPITTFTALLMTLGLMYLLFQRKEDILALFRHYKSTAPILGNKTLRIAARVFCIVIPISFLTYYKSNVYASDKYFGKWKVETMMRNGKTLPENAWEKDTLAWKNIYFEERGKVYYCPNPYVYVDSVSILMKYDYNKTENSLKVISYEKNAAQPDTLPVQIKNFNGNTMQWNMVFYQDTLQLQLKKVSGNN